MQYGVQFVFSATVSKVEVNSSVLSKRLMSTGGETSADTVLPDRQRYQIRSYIMPPRFRQRQLTKSHP